MTTEFSRVSVLGAGTMGAGIAQVCASAGSDVVLQDITEEFAANGMSRIRAFLQKGVEKGKVTEAQRDATLARIATATDRVDACREADLVIEAVPEDLALKNELFRELGEAVGSECILASNTSSLALHRVFEGVAGPGRCIGHAFLQPGAAA